VCTEDEEKKLPLTFLLMIFFLAAAYPQVAQEEGEDAKRVADMDGIHMYGLKLGRVRELIKQRVSTINRRMCIRNWKLMKQG
jgi:hypothetical protein